MDSLSTTHSRSSTLFAAGAVALALATASGGCDQETGIIIEVDKGTLGAAPDTLTFLIGVEADPFAPNANTAACATGDEQQRFVLTEQAASDVASVGDRDLASAPYRLFLRPDANQDSGGKLMVLVKATKRNESTGEDEVIGYGTLANPVDFVPDETVKWKISLAPAPGDPVSDRLSCYCASDFGGPAVLLPHIDDADCDGTPSSDARECDDNNPLVPAPAEVCGNQVDDNCDGRVDEIAEEVCDGRDNNCDGMIDENSEPEVCDGKDNDCDGLCDEGFDEDGDTYSVCGSRVDNGVCQGDVDPDMADCADNRPGIHPGAIEQCDGIDRNCVPGDELPFVEPVHCYTQDSDDEPCLVGRRRCDNTTGGELTECVPLKNKPTYLASPRSCQVEDACFVQTDNFTCSNDRWYNASMTCTVNVIGTPFGLNVCEGAEVPIPGMGADGEDCKWTVLGAGLDLPYHIQLESRTGDTGHEIEDCLPTIQFTGFFGEPTDGEEAYLWMSKAGEPTTHLRVQLFALEIAECPLDNIPTVTCDNLIGM